MLVFGIEGTAWAASAAVYDVEADSVAVETDAYQPDSGGIDPSEAAEHMRSALPSVVDRTLENHVPGPADEAIDAVAFSRGPGLGPCLRVAGTTARSLAGSLDVPLVGVNHMLAHCEIGRHGAGFDRPVCLNASGANAHVLGFHGGRYRVLGETMDTGVGNAIDKFTRHLGWSHPGGPKVERRANEGEYVDLPYVVKGMDFSFSGIMSAAKAAVDDGTPVEDVCFSLQENVFGMLTEVAERAMALTGSTELVLGGGVGQNRRLQAMLAEMCEDRGAEFFAPEDRFLRDNAGMIAVLGARMFEAGDTVPVAESRVIPGYRPDEVPVTWRAGESVAVGDRAGEDRHRGAEAVVTVEGDRVVKRRVPKGYRHAALDDRLRRDRTVLEARLTSKARRSGVPTPLVLDVDPEEARLVLQFVGDADLRDLVDGAGDDATVDGSGDAATGDASTGHGSGTSATEADPERLVRTVGEHLARLHGEGFVHGDPTPRNVRVGDRVYLIDFGLGYHTDTVEDFAMDLHVFRQGLAGTAEDVEGLAAAAEDGYRERGDPRVVDQLREIDRRGRYREQDGE
ncbi:serine/threonine protein kinase [Halobacteriales archaeon QS_8_69_26]|nr:MAG: serine/threonine protein kinase [Halobacteriales archaeon QS_8_69_26]